MTPADQTAAVRLRLAIATVAVIAAACGEHGDDIRPRRRVGRHPVNGDAPDHLAVHYGGSCDNRTAVVDHQRVTDHDGLDRCVRVTDFDEPNWFIVNDGVMGGRSDAEA